MRWREGISGGGGGVSLLKLSLSPPTCSRAIATRWNHSPSAEASPRKTKYDFIFPFSPTTQRTNQKIQIELSFSFFLDCGEVHLDSPGSWQNSAGRARACMFSERRQRFSCRIPYHSFPQSRAEKRSWRKQSRGKVRIIIPRDEKERITP